MKKRIIAIAVFLGSSLLYAQSGTSRFIDSPSWVLASGQDAAATTEVAAPQPARAVSVQTKTPKETKTGNEAKTVKKTFEAPVNEGFFHIGVYVAPTVNWAGQIKGDFKRDGAMFNVTPTVMVDLRVFRRLFLGFGLAFNSIGGSMACPDILYTASNGNDEIMKHTRTYTFSYVEVPVRLKLKTPDFIGGKGSFFFSAGLYTGLGTLWKYTDFYTNMEASTLDNGLQKGNFTTKARMQKSTKIANLSAVGQIGYNHSLGKHLHLNIAAEYHYGTVQPVKKDMLNQHPQFHNHQVALVFGVMF